jgi:glycosyltransferase involved in cell wall biosynthesis
MSLDRPTVSICLPVYNGERYIRYAIKSILEQTFEDFELIISDNASTDATADISREATARDPRVHYYRVDVNRGSAWNHNRTFKLAKGRYVAWIGHDDVMAKEYIARCVETLEKDPGAVLCFAAYNYIDERGSLIKRPPMENPGALERPSARFVHIIYECACLAIYGVMKTQTLKQTALHGGFADCDRVLLAEMGLRGRFSLVPEPLFSRRYHAERVTTKYRSLRERTLIMDPTKSGRLFLPVMLQAVAFCSAIQRANLPLTERLRCYRSLLGWLRLMRRDDLVSDLRERMLSTIKSLL